MTHRNIVFALTMQNINILQIFFTLGFLKHSTGSNIRFLPQRGGRETLQRWFTTQGRRLSVFLYQTRRDKTRGRRGGLASIQMQSQWNRQQIIFIHSLFWELFYIKLKGKKKPQTPTSLSDHQSSEQNTDLLAPDQVPVIFIRVVPRGPSQCLDSGGQSLSGHVVPQGAFQFKREDTTQEAPRQAQNKEKLAPIS